MQENFEEMRFPPKGIDLHFREELRTPETTSLGDNVRTYEALTKRGRGGSRPGISKYLPTQPNGNNPIQELTAIVSTSGEALGWSFNGQDFGDAGFGGIDFGPAGIGGSADGPIGGGGGGYQPSVSFQEKRTVTAYLIAVNLEDSAGGLPNSVEVFLNGTSGANVIGNLVIDSVQNLDEQFFRTDPTVGWSDDYLTASFGPPVGTTTISKSKFHSGSNTLRLQLSYIGGNDVVEGHVQVTIVRQSAGGGIWLTDSKPLIDAYLKQAPGGGLFNFDFVFFLP